MNILSNGEFKDKLLCIDKVQGGSINTNLLIEIENNDSISIALKSGKFIDKIQRNKSTLKS